MTRLPRVGQKPKSRQLGGRTGLDENPGSGQFGFDSCSHRPAGYRGGALTHYNHPCDASGSQVTLETPT